MRHEDRHARAERKVREMRARFSSISRRADRRALVRRYAVVLMLLAACGVVALTLWFMLPFLLAG